MPQTAQIVEVTAGEIALELQRHGISADARVTPTIEPRQELVRGRRGARACRGRRHDGHRHRPAGGAGAKEAEPGG